MPPTNQLPQDKEVNLKEKTAIVYDNGLFVELAKTLSKSFKKVYYFMPWKNAFPRSNQMVVGEGIEGIERINNFFDYVNQADIIIFPDVYDGDLQLYLQRSGKLVWGGRKGEEMELYRDKMKEYMKKVGLFVTNYEVIKGIDKLREYLKEHDNVWIKQNITRGDFETMYSKNYKLIEPVIDELEHSLGAVKNIKEFVVEDAYDDAVEAGFDFYTIDGQFPTKTLLGIEVKDLGYIGKVLQYSSVSEKLTDFNTKIQDALKNYGYRGFLSTEVRVSKDRPPYMLDFCARAGSPPSELYQLMYKNIAEIIWYGSQGIMLDPVTEKRYGVETLMHSAWADKNWQAIYFPPEYRDNIKLRNACNIDGKFYCVPQAVGLPEIGAVVTEGNTLKEAIDLNMKISKSIEGHYIDIKTESLNEATGEFEKLEAMGIKIL